MSWRLADPRDRDERLRRAREFVDALGLRTHRALVFGSVARGDFTAESDTDLLVISDELPASPRERIALLYSGDAILPEIEPIGWREQDWRRREEGGDPFVEVLKREAVAL